jgi:hypothetical protein
MFHIHKWSKWEEYKAYFLPLPIRAQTRKCVKCGKWQLQHL